MKSGRPLDIAIVGMACRFPGARDLASFWENVLSARDCTGDVPPDRWDPAVFFDPDSAANDRVYCRRGGYLDAPIEFDPSAHGIMPLAVAGGEPEQYLVLDAAKAALADAGMAAGVPDGRRVEVVIGRGNYFNRGNLTRLQHGRIVAQTLQILRELHPDWTEADLAAVRADLKAGLPPFEPATIAGQLTNATAGRVANRLDLNGASFVVDAASASSLVALDLAARALVDCRADLALAGGVYLAADVDFPLVFCQLGALSRRGQARPFSRDADGMLPGEGVGVVVLKRLGDAERDGDRVYAILKGVGLASDGRRTGPAAPSARGHARAIRRAYRRSGIDPASIGLVEGHGLGVPASDRAELRALRAVFPPARSGRRDLGAVSALIGHAMPAAGIAGLIKAALALHNRVIPPSPHVDDPHPLLADDQSPFQMRANARPWIHGEPDHPRRAGVNAFGFAGISTHAILEEHGPSADGSNPGPQPRWETEAILLGAADRGTWIDRARRLLDWLGREANQPVSLKDLAATLNSPPDPGPFRVGFVVQSPAELRDRLRATIERLSDHSCQAIRDARGTYFWDSPLAGPGRLAFLFPGEGSQYPGMLADLCPHFPEVRERFDIADRVAIRRGYTGGLPSQIVFAAANGPDAGLWSAGTALNVVLSAQWALHQLLANLGLRPDAVVGHSSGEFLAMASAGAFSVDQRLEDGLGELGRVFEQLEQSGRVPNARLVAVAADRAVVEDACHRVGPGTTIAIDNCPHQVVFAGASGPVDAVLRRLRAQGVMCEELPFDRAYHTPAFSSALGPVRAFFRDMPLNPPRVALYSCAVACQLSGDVEQLRRVAVEQWALPVAFQSTVKAMYADGIRVFVEVGARGNLTGFVDDTLRDLPHFAVAANLPRRSGLTQLNHLVASLFAQGVPLQTGHLYARRRPVRIDLERDLPSRRALPALAVGFPEMRLSRELASRLGGAAGAPPLAVVEAPATAVPPPAFEPHHSNGHAASPKPTLDVPPAPPVAEPSAAPPEPHPPARPAPARANPAGREAAILAHLRTMDAFLETQRQVMGAYGLARQRAGQGRPGPAPAGAARGRVEAGPWVGTIDRLVPGRELVATRRLELRDDPVAEHHTLGGRRVSALEPELKGLPVVPFTVMAEMLAQAAAVLAPGEALVALRDVHAHKWIRYEAGPITLELRARRDPERPGEVGVSIVNRGTASARGGQGPDGPVVEGRAVFADARPPAPAAPPFALERPRACRFTADELYADQWLFHGPALQAVVRVGQSSPGGIEGTLRVLPRRGVLRDSEPMRLQTDPIILDAFTHLLGCWGLDQLPEGDVIFPLRVAEIAFFGADPAEGERVECRIAVRELSRPLVRVDADLVGPGGRVWMRIAGWEDWRFYWPGHCRDQFRQPDRFFVGEPLPLPGAQGLRAGEAQAVWLEPPRDLAKPIWRDVLEWLQLGPDERSSLRARARSDREWTQLLWGRVAAKEAARRLWAEQGEAASYPADLVVEGEAVGRLSLRSRLDASRVDLPAVAIAHADGVALALAASDPGSRPGVAVGPVSEELDDAPAALTGAERDRLDEIVGGPASRAEWAARFHCARDAARSALGREVEILDADTRSGEVVVAVGPGVATGRDCEPVRVITARRGDLAWAWTLGEPASRRRANSDRLRSRDEQRR